MNFIIPISIIIIIILIISNIVIVDCLLLNGRYTNDIKDFYLSVPLKLNNKGQFHSYCIPHYFTHDFNKKKRKRSLNDQNIVHYGIHVNNKLYHFYLWPNQGFISPNIVFEHREPKAKIQDKQLRTLANNKLCHYTGHLRNHPNSKCALSTCDGLSGYLTIGKKRYFIEPLKEHTPNEHGHHLHIIYERNVISENISEKTCGTSDNWEESWKERFYEKYNTDKKMTRGKLKRGTSSVHRFLETLVVCDKKFVQHHKNIDIENYVADYYHDSSSGNQMDVVVVRIIYLEKEEEEIDLVINANAEDTLASFCKWQNKINTKDISNPSHHDIAVLLTRYDICADNLKNCGLMGLANVAAACTGDKSCAINEDSGLVLGVVTAHEMGHVMGCAHDKEGESSCPAQDTDESFFIMAPFVHIFTTRWSTCSRGFITSLFEKDLGECLNDEPQSSIYKFKEMLPGTVYDADQQCQMDFPGSTVCKVEKDKFCKMLLCKTSPTECMGNDEPPADGTSCGEGKWCYRMKCVSMGQRPEAINGGWGNWGSWSKCSRTCGGGVSLSTRDCNNPTPENKGLYCIGDRKRIKICNFFDCPSGTTSFREVQCKEHNVIPFNEKLYEWKPFFKKEDPCVLYCLNNENVFAALENRVKDGTKCRPGTKDMCISGECKKIGCDGEIDSKAVEDICGVCNGDGTQCKVIEEIYKAKAVPNYQKVVTIPAGSVNVIFEELKPSINTIAVSDKSGNKFFLNGKNSEENDGDKDFDGTPGIYTHPEALKELLEIHGPLKNDIVLYVVFYDLINPGFKYKYSEPSMNIDYTPNYHWELIDWESCSMKCGGGVQNAVLSCIEKKSGKVSDTFCSNLDKPSDLIKKCNEAPCKTKWRVGKWGKCHACKFKSGVRVRGVECVRETPHQGADDIIVEDNECKGEKPGTRELCNSHVKCKNPRFAEELTDRLMRAIWKQTNKYYKTKQKRKATCTNSVDHQPSTVLVKDRIPDKDIKLIRIPIKSLHLNLSDAAFETMGEDEVEDILDMTKAKILTGTKAAKIYQQFAETTTLKYLKDKKNAEH